MIRSALRALFGAIVPDGAWPRLLQRVADTRPYRVITGSGDGATPYLYKYLLWASRPTTSSIKAGVRVHLHRFVRDDADRDPHNHPWAWGYSLILSGGYREERVTKLLPYPDRVTGDCFESRTRDFLPLDTNAVPGDCFHRADLLAGRECWTLFVTGPVLDEWGFRERKTGAFVPWREYVSTRMSADPDVVSPTTYTTEGAS